MSGASPSLPQHTVPYLMLRQRRHLMPIRNIAHLPDTLRIKIARHTFCQSELNLAGRSQTMLPGAMCSISVRVPPKARSNLGTITRLHNPWAGLPKY